MPCTNKLFDNIKAKAMRQLHVQGIFFSHFRGPCRPRINRIKCLKKRFGVLLNDQIILFYR